MERLDGRNLQIRTKTSAQDWGKIAKEYLISAFVTGYFRTLHRSKIRNFINEEMVPDMVEGIARSMGDDAEVILSGTKKEYKHEEKIPHSGPILITPNHFAGGPINGYGTHFGIAAMTKRARGEDIKYILQDALVNPITGGRVFRTKEFYGYMNCVYEHHAVPPPMLKVDGEASDLSSLRGIRVSFKTGEAVGLYPELTSTRELARGNYLAGIVARSFMVNTRGSGLIVPVGVWEEGKKLCFRVGEPYESRELEILLRRNGNGDTRVNQQKASDYMMAKVNLLVPPQMRNMHLSALGGVYGFDNAD